MRITVVVTVGFVLFSLGCGGGGTNGTPPTADFIWAPDTPNLAVPVSFTDTSLPGSGVKNAWNWTFTGGTPATSTVQNPTGVTFATPGSHNVTLLVTCDNGLSNSATKAVSIVAINPPTASFTHTPETPAIGANVAFTDTSIAVVPATITTWNWTFVGGTPTTGSAQNPGTVTFATAGFHSVTLTVTDNTGLTNTYTHSVGVSDPLDVTKPDIDVTSAVLHGSASDSSGVTAISDDVSSGDISDTVLPANNALWSTHEFLIGSPLTPGDGAASVDITASGSTPPAMQAQHIDLRGTVFDAGGTPVEVVINGTPYPVSGGMWQQDNLSLPSSPSCFALCASDCSGNTRIVDLVISSAETPGAVQTILSVSLTETAMP